MKPYGHKRSDSKTCKWGCCGVKKSNIANQKPVKRTRVDKAARRRARRQGKAAAKAEIS